MDVIYGEDNRQDLYEVQNPLYLKLANSTAGLVNLRMLQEHEDSFEVTTVRTLEQGANVCPSEKFSDQPMLAGCSGFLVAPNIIVSAGHCYRGRAEGNCESSAWVFGLHMQNSKDINISRIPKENVYRCKKIISAVLDRENDYAVIELDRDVVGREPLKVRREGKVSEDANLVVIGHPTMMPTKVSDGGTVLYNDNDNKFITTLDTFQGNSGSAVFDADTGLLEGILVSGKTDYIPSDLTDPFSCKVVNTCEMDGKNCEGKDRGSILIPGEAVTRITTLTQHIP